MKNKKVDNYLRFFNLRDDVFIASDFFFVYRIIEKDPDSVFPIVVIQNIHCEATVSFSHHNNFIHLHCVQTQQSVKYHISILHYDQTIVQ